MLAPAQVHVKTVGPRKEGVRSWETRCGFDARGTPGARERARDHEPDPLAAARANLARSRYVLPVGKT